eukprot:c42257_g1_i1 orf=46-219(+)
MHSFNDLVFLLLRSLVMGFAKSRKLYDMDLHLNFLKCHEQIINIRRRVVFFLNILQL